MAMGWDSARRNHGCIVHIDIIDGKLWVQEDELCTRLGNVRYRMLYFFHGTAQAVISHGIAKKTAEVPPIEISRAIERKKKFEQNPQRHTQEMEI